MDEELGNLGSGPILSICIPTYNRADLLGEALDAIFAQVNGGNSAAIEVVVSDNASPDATADVVQGMALAHPNVRVRYSRQATNVGPDRNILDVMFMGKGLYVLLLSDDDLLLPGALDAILARLRQQPGLNALALNLCGFSTNAAMLGPPSYRLEADRLILDRGDAILYLGTKLTFVSSLIVRRDLFQDRDYSGSLGTYFPHSHVFLDALAHEGGMLAMKNPGLAVRENASVSYNLYVAFLTGFSKVMEYAEESGFPRSATKKVLRSHRRWVAGMTTRFVSSGVMGWRQLGRWDAIRRLYEVYGVDPYILIRVVPVLLLPIWAVRVLAKLYKGGGWCKRLLRTKVSQLIASES